MSTKRTRARLENWRSFVRASTSCTTCGADRGEPCTDRKGEPRKANHQARDELVRRRRR